MGRFLERVHDVCERYPDRVAFVDDIRSMTFAELWEESGKVFAYLAEKGLGTEDFCQIVLPRSASSMASLLGVLRAGCAFCNLDDGFPPERIRYIREDLGAKMVIDADRYAYIMANEQAASGYVTADPHDAAFAVYTSGSTGTPKGVLHEVGNLDLCLSLYPEQDVYPDAPACLSAPFYSVASVLLAINCMAVARTTHIVSPLMFRDPNAMSAFLIKNRIEDTFLPTSFLRLYTNPSPYLKTILAGAERVDGVYYESGSPVVLNYFSMTEAGFPLLVFKVDRRYEHTPVGTPVVPGIDLHLEDEEGRRIEGPGEGEICFINRFVRGYINLPEATAKAWRDGVFHTNDIARRDERGIYTIVGRADDMFKIAGNRVEPSEIELVYKRLTGAVWCCAKGFDGPTGAFVCLYHQGALEKTADEIRQELAAYLPEYMVPAMFVEVDEIPFTEHGKVDRKLLPDPRMGDKRLGYVEPADELERKLADAMGAVFGIDLVGATDDFLDLGGSSVSAMQLVAGAGIEGLAAADIFDGRTVTGICKRYRERIAREAAGDSLEERERRARLSAQPLLGSRLYLIRLINAIPENRVYVYPFLVSFAPDADEGHVLSTVHAIMAHQAVFSAVTECHEDGSYWLRYDPSTLRLPEIERMSEAEFRSLLDAPYPPIDLTRPPVYVRVIATESSVYAWLVFNHLGMDGSSLALISGNLIRAYLGQPLEPDYYFAYLEDEANLRDTETWRADRAYYEGLYGTDDWVSNIPQDLHGDILKEGAIDIPVAMTPENLAEMEQRSKVTRANFCNAVYLLAMAKLNGADRVAFAALFHGRTDELRRQAAGNTLTFLVIGVDLRDLDTLQDLYDEVTKRAADALAHHTFDWRSYCGTPYEREYTTAIYQPPSITGTDAFDALGIKAEELDNNDDYSHSVSTMTVVEHGSSITANFTYCTSRISAAMACAFAKTYTALVDAMLFVEDPAQVRIKDVLDGVPGLSEGK